VNHGLNIAKIHLRFERTNFLAALNFCIPVSRKSGHPMTLQSSEFGDFLTEKAGHSSNSNMHCYRLKFCFLARIFISCSGLRWRWTVYISRKLGNPSEKFQFESVNIEFFAVEVWRRHHA
jgi:hypothetical protein